LLSTRLSVHSSWSSSASLCCRYVGQQVSRQLQNGRELQTRIYELDEPSPKSPQGWRREKPGETNATTGSSHENELKSHAGTDENISNHNYSILPHIRCDRICSSLACCIRSLHLPIRFEPFLLLLVLGLLFHNQRTAVKNFRRRGRLFHDSDWRWRRRLIKMTRPSQKTHGRRKLPVRLPSGHRTFHFEPKTSAVAQCARCGKELHGVPTTRPQSFARSSRAPSRQYGGVLCSNCLAAEIRALVRSGTAS
jgi:large subunit ribosomal protein L34e